MADEPVVLAVLDLHVEAGKVRELARALRADEDVVPPTFNVVVAHTVVDGEAPNQRIIAAAGLDPARVVLGDMAWTFHRRLVVGERLRGEVRYLGCEQRAGRRGGALRIARGGTFWFDAGGEPVLDALVSLIEPERAVTA